MSGVAGSETCIMRDNSSCRGNRVNRRRECAWRWVSTGKRLNSTEGEAVPSLEATARRDYV